MQPVMVLVPVSNFSKQLSKITSLHAAAYNYWNVEVNLIVTYST